MERRITGAIFIMIAAVLYSANMISISSLDFDWTGGIQNAQENVGYSLIILSIVAGIIGIIYLVLAEIKK